MKKLKKVIGICFSLVVCLALMAGCGNNTSSLTADLSYTRSDLGALSVSSDVRVVGLGEASHGVAEYQQMKADVFKALVKNNGCRTFIIEGDFGGALKVDQYINGGGGTAEEAVAEIGFEIYRTQELAELVAWMRSYNESVPEEDALHFYGMDVQRFDNNKEYLFSVIDQTHPELSAKYKEAFAQLTDENRTSLDKDTLDRAKEKAFELIEELEISQAEIVDDLGQAHFDFAKECAKTIYACCEVQLSNNYNATRDQYMYEKVEWFIQHGNDSVLFINGHNGHIGKTSAAGYTCLGELLSEHLGSGYYSIGTDAQETEFNSQLDSGGFEVVKVINANDLNAQLNGSDDRLYFIDFASAAHDEAWKSISQSKQTITALNVSLSGIHRKIKSAYTVTITPQDAFDGMIVFQAVTPTTLLKPFL